MPDHCKKCFISSWVLLFVNWLLQIISWQRAKLKDLHFLIFFLPDCWKLSVKTREVSCFSLDLWVYLLNQIVTFLHFCILNFANSDVTIRQFCWLTPAPCVLCWNKSCFFHYQGIFAKKIELSCEICSVSLDLFSYFWNNSRFFIMNVLLLKIRQFVKLIQYYLNFAESIVPVGSVFSLSTDHFEQWCTSSWFFVTVT